MSSTQQEPEATPLLSTANDYGAMATSPIAEEDKVVTTPLPMFQLVILGLVRLAEPIAYTQIFPYVNDMTEHSGVTTDPSQIGFYSGLLDSTFAIAQLVTIYSWGTLSDKIGRKPIILVGLTGGAVSTLLFGLSSSFWWAVATRALAGAFSGNAAVMNSAVGEITDATNITLAFSITSAFWVMGTVLGPLLGGSLTRSGEHIDLFHRYPYLAPCLASASLTALSILIGVMFMKETLPSKLKPKPDAILTTLPEFVPTFYETISSVCVRRVLLAILIQNTVAMGFDVLFALFAYTPLDLGGLGRTPAQIGGSLAVAAVIGAILPIVVTPYLQRRTKNDVKLYTYLMSGWVITYLVAPIAVGMTYLTASVGGHHQSVPRHGGFVWATVAAMLLGARSCAMAWSLSQVLLKHSSPSPNALGGTFGLGQMVGCVGRAVGPALTSSLFAISIGQNLLGGQLVWLFMSCIAAVGVWSASRVIDSGNSR